IESPLGAGGVGARYPARDTRLGRAAAVKGLGDSVSHSAQALERFQREARAASALSHPPICPRFHVGTDPPFIALELLEGKPLQHRLMGGALDLASLVDITLAIADALEAAQSKGITHRDIKPANLFLTEHGPKILDFGLAKAAPVSAVDATFQPT